MVYGVKWRGGAPPAQLLPLPTYTAVMDVTRNFYLSFAPSLSGADVRFLVTTPRFPRDGRQISFCRFGSESSDANPIC